MRRKEEDKERGKGGKEWNRGTSVSVGEGMTAKCIVFHKSGVNECGGNHTGR